MDFFVWLGFFNESAKIGQMEVLSQEFALLTLDREASGRTY